MRQITYTVGPLDTADPNGICESQTPTVGELDLDGALVTDGIAYLVQARRVLITTVADESANTFTITGTDAFNNVISEEMVGPDSTTGYTDQDFLTVTSVSIDDNAVGAITVGTNGVASSPPLPLDIHGRPEISLQAIVSGTVNWTVQQTLDSPYVGQTLNWIDHPDANMVSEAVNRQGNYAYVPACTRIVLNSGTGSVTYTVVQAGITG